MNSSELDLWHMRRALQLAQRGQGLVEPNPMVGCVLAVGAEPIGEGWHQRFGGPHAEIEALRLAGEKARNATVYVTLEPCSHHGKTPPCSQSLIEAGVARVVVAMADPFPQVDGGGIRHLEAAGIEVQLGCLEHDARRLNGPYLKLLDTGRPWVLVKWAMTLDGKTATHTGSSQWISSEASRERVHRLRGRVDAILVGSKTARLDDPMLTARPPGPRTALRVVADTRASLDSESHLVRTASEAPLMVAVGSASLETDRKRLRDAGCEVFLCEGETDAERLDALLSELGHRRLTNLLVESGGLLSGSLLDGGHIDEVHVFIAPKLIGGLNAPSPIAGEGITLMNQSIPLEDLHWEPIGSDLYLSARLVPRRKSP